MSLMVIPTFLDLSCIFGICQYSGMVCSQTRPQPVTFFIFRYEFFFGGMSSSNLCVTQAMQRDLWEHWGIRLELN